MGSDKKDPATKADLQASEKRLDLRISSVERRLDQKIDRVYSDLARRLDATAGKADVAHINQRLDQIVGIMDTFSGKVVDQDKTVLVFDHILKDHRLKLADHGERLARLESKA